MIGKVKHRTKDDRDRIEICKRNVCCLPCLLKGWANVQADYHHVLEGGRRLSHQHGYPSCLWHHRGVLDPGYADLTLGEVEARIGPSFATKRTMFKAEFGTEQQLVDTATFAVQLYRQRPWPDFEMPAEVLADIVMFNAKMMISDS